MPSPYHHTVALDDEAGTVLLAEDMAAILRPGDVLALEGDLGAGKTTFARALLRALADDPRLEVPSPTYTLVQPYQLPRLQVWHLDLYRLEEPDEVDELGFDELMQTGAVLVEWPQRAEGRLPVDTLWLSLQQAGAPDARTVELRAASGDWARRLGRSRQVRGFLDASGWAGAQRRYLQGDASARSYETVRAGDRQAVLMNAPRRADGPPVRDGKPYSRIAHLAEDVRPFVAIGGALRAAGFAAPELYAHDLKSGLLLLEDLGREQIARDQTPIAERYEVAVDLLAALHGVAWPAAAGLPDGSDYRLPRYDREALGIEAELYVDWYLPDVRGVATEAPVREAFQAAWSTVFDRLEASPKSWVLRDFHSPNIIWRSQAEGLARIGLIDFQDALIGPPAYDVASITQDARVTIPVELEQRLLERYIAARLRAQPGFDAARFREDHAALAAHRATKVLGIFTRLARRDGKHGYLRHIPRIQAYLARSLAHPGLADLKRWYDRHSPETGPSGDGGSPLAGATERELNV